MKNTTLKQIQQVGQFISKAIVDRRSKKQNAVIEEQRSITKECNGNVLPAYLYNYYVSICQIPSWDLTNDAKVAKQLGVSERKIADTRRLLTKKEWIRLDTHKHGDVMYGIWYLGREVVQAKIGVDTSLEEYKDLGVILEDEYAAAKKYENLVTVNTTNICEVGE